jgi:hypothetical protein
MSASQRPVRLVSAQRVHREGARRHRFFQTGMRTVKLPRYIGLCGNPGSGKSEVQKILRGRFSVQPVDDGHALRDFCQIHLGLSYDDVHKGHNFDAVRQTDTPRNSRGSRRFSFFASLERMRRFESRQEESMTNKTWTYILTTFALSVSFSTGPTYWTMKRESDHYSALFNMMVKRRLRRLRLRQSRRAGRSDGSCR